MTSNDPNDSQLAEILWDENGFPFSKHFNDIYFSKTDGVAESQHVFVQGNKLVERWENLADGACFVIGETGFGTGLNFLVAWDLWKSLALAETTQLHFCSVEKYPLSRLDLKICVSAWPRLRKLGDALVESYPPQPVSGLHRMIFDGGRVVLSLYYGDATEGFEQMAPISNAGPQLAQTTCGFGPYFSNVDAWFLDGFSPAKNPKMWNQQLFKALGKLSDIGTSFATFTSAGAVRRELVNIGFKCEKAKGFGRKREMLVGTMCGKANKNDEIADEQRYWETGHRRPYTSKLSQIDSSWHLMENNNRPKIQQCVIIGGGLAGCHTAFALAQKNIRVSLIEKHSHVATEASGNRQGVVYAKLSPHHDSLSTFNLTALIFAQQFYHANNFYRDCGEQCGVLHLAMDDRQQGYYKRVAANFSSENSFVQWLTSEDCRKISGVDSEHAALYLPQAGWLDPAKLCQHLLKHPLITTHANTNVVSIARENGHWQLLDQKRQPLLEADTVIIANANDARQFSQTRTLPLKKLRGQVSYLPISPSTESLCAVLCGEGYVTPAYQGMHAFGATYTPSNIVPDLCADDHRENLERLKSLSPQFAELKNYDHSRPLAGRVGFRCTTPDYFPLVGPVADIENMMMTFGGLRQSATRVIDKPGVYQPQLYCNLGHGSRGLCYTPLCSELLASIIAGQFLPLTRSLYLHLHPARFLIRDLVRKHI